LKRVVVTWAQECTPKHKGFFESLKHYPGELLVIAGRYNNPTSIWTDTEKGKHWYDKDLEPFLVRNRVQLCPNLCVMGDVHIRPTAKRPLTGWEVTVGKNSAIMGHSKLAFKTVATATRVPRLLMSTGACTLANYTDSNAGKHGEAHHIIGAVVVEIEDDGTFYTRQINAEKSGAFIDLDKKYTPKGVEQAAPILALTMGDIHVGQEEPSVLEATQEIVALLKPKYLILHDLLDFRSRNHHDKGLKQLFEKFITGTDSVEKEVKEAVNAIRIFSTWADNVVVVRANHDAAFDRYLEECDPHKDISNARYYFAVWNRIFEEQAKTGKWPDALEMEARRLGVPSSVRFLARNEDFTLNEVSYGFHGDIGISGSRGSSGQFAKLGVKTVTAHSHQPGIEDGNYVAGVTAKLDQSYNMLPSAWLHAHVVQYANGKRSIYHIWNGKFRGTESAKKKAA
jgi:hypothetical protein